MMSMLDGVGHDSPNTVISFVNRGDPAAWDFQTGDLSTDGNWHVMDLSAIVPAGAVAIVLHLHVRDNIGGGVLEFRRNGNVNAFATADIGTLPANQTVHGLLTVACDTARRIEYRATNMAWNTIQICINGWFAR